MTSFQVNSVKLSFSRHSVIMTIRVVQRRLLHQTARSFSRLSFLPDLAGICPREFGAVSREPLQNASSPAIGRYAQRNRGTAYCHIGAKLEFKLKWTQLNCLHISSSLVLTRIVMGTRPKCLHGKHPPPPSISGPPAQFYLKNSKSTALQRLSVGTKGK